MLTFNYARQQLTIYSFFSLALPQTQVLQPRVRSRFYLSY